MARKPGLTPKQQRFVEEYLVDLNATQAAIRAGFKHSDIGRQLITKNHVQKAIEAAKAKRSERTEITQEYVLDRLKREAELDGEGASHSARVSAVNLLGKHLGMFGDKLEIRGEATIRITKKVVGGS